MWAEQKASRSLPGAGSEEAGLRWRGVRVRRGRVGGLRFCCWWGLSWWGRLRYRVGRAPGRGQSTGVGAERALRSAGVRSEDPVDPAGWGWRGPGWGRTTGRPGGNRGGGVWSRGRGASGKGGRGSKASFSRLVPFWCELQGRQGATVQRGSCK